MRFCICIFLLTAGTVPLDEAIAVDVVFFSSFVSALVDLLTFPFFFLGVASGVRSALIYRLAAAPRIMKTLGLDLRFGDLFYHPAQKSYGFGVICFCHELMISYMIALLHRYNEHISSVLSFFSLSFFYPKICLPQSTHILLSLSLLHELYLITILVCS